jgi:hypothetical protein
MGDMNEDWEMRALTAERKARGLEEQLRTSGLRLAVEREGRKVGLVDTDAAFRLLDRDAIAYDTDGAPSNVGALLANLVKAKPYLAGATEATEAGKGADSFTAAMLRGAGLTKKG